MALLNLPVAKKEHDFRRRPKQDGLIAMSKTFCLILISCNFFLPSGESCDFDDMDMDQIFSSRIPTNRDPCQLWDRPLASDGTSGFYVTNFFKELSRKKTYSGHQPGPLKDASERSKHGHYALFQNEFHEEKTEAEIRSPWYGSSGPRCNLTFSINIVGTNVGVLLIYIQTGNSGIFRSLWQVSGDHGPSWVPHEIEIGKIQEPFRVIFRAIRGIGDDGHIALDALSLDYCNPDLPVKRTCALKEFMCATNVCISRDKVCDFNEDCLDGEDERQPYCETIPKIGRCDFEDGYCGWRNSSITDMPPTPFKKIYPWVRHKGPTPDEMTGPSKDHTYYNKEGIDGHYIYSAKPAFRKNNFQHLPMIIDMPLLPPPPEETWQENSPFYHTCHVRFFYHMWGAHIISLHVYKEEMDGEHCPPNCKGVRRTDLGSMRPNGHGSDVWLRNSLPIGEAKTPFRLKFYALCGPRNLNSDVAIDDVSLSPECFGLGIINITNNGTEYAHELLSMGGVEIDDPENDERCHSMGSMMNDIRHLNTMEDQCMWDAKDLFRIQRTTTSSDFETITEVMNQTARFMFKTCGNSGPSGPSQFQCDAAYRATELADDKVTVLADDFEKGIQVWVVPETRIYSITALGASGGAGLQNSEPSRGAYANAKFNLTKNEKIYILVGQMGQSACEQVNKDNQKTKEICTKGLFEAANGQNGKYIRRAGGGGGGGGGTFVYKMDPVAKELVPLIIAGGGGGKSYMLGHDPVRADGGLSPTGSGSSGITPMDGPGAGGGWDGYRYNRTQGAPLVLGGEGGEPCREALESYDWRIYGGFGGGGGGCTAGGGGGGYSGGNVSQADGPEHNGQGGSSYISPLGIRPVFEPGTSEGHGEVEIAIVFPCACQFMCIYYNYEQRNFKCYCPANHVLADDGLSCINTKDLPNDKTPLTTIIGFTIGGIFIFVFLIILSVFLVVARLKQRPPVTRLDMLTNADYQLDRLRSQIGGQGIMSEYNPNYDFGGTKCTLQDLREIPRANLTLVRGLGQGAFGEVYQGYLANEPRENREIPVAVKTLPALSSEQAEMDFLMEALIMSKFQHANIVRFIGVCFEKHPRFIILELLEGGDLKTFLRNSRPKPDQPSRVTMVDLVKLSLDVAKGCKYLEENHFIHRDIAARNCLLTSKGPDRVAKIADFGMARDIYRADYYRKGGKAMLPVKWMPPEAFLDGIFTSKTDVWSFGILLWEVFSLGYMPYPGRGNQEVMQLVRAGGRLELPENCPAPLYYIMTLCWHGITDKRPNFANIIERLERCLQDPQVVHSPLPVFRRPPSFERDTTIMRPRDPDRTVLTVEPQIKYLEPDSPSSMDQLIGPQSPDIADQLLQKRPNLRASAESIDELLRQEGAAGQEDLDPHGPSAMKGPFSYQRVFDYDLAMDSIHGGGGSEGIQAAAAAHGGTGNDILLNAIPEGGRGCASSAAPVLTAEPAGGRTVNGAGATNTDDSTGDSGKSSLENMSQTDSASQVSGTSSNSCPSGPKQPENGSKSSTKQTFPHPCTPVREGSKKSSFSAPLNKNKDWSNHDKGGGDNGGDICYRVATRSSPSSSHPQSPTYPALVTGSQNTGATLSGAPHSPYVESSNADPWERRLPQQEQQQLQQQQQQQQQQQFQRGAAAMASSDPQYVNINVARNNMGGSRKTRPAQSGRINLEGPSSNGVGASSHEKIQHRHPQTYRSPIPSMSESRRDEEASKDPGDSGVVIDFKDKPDKRQDSKGQTWL